MEKLLNIIEVCQKNDIECVVDHGSVRVFPGVLDMTVYTVDMTSTDEEFNELMEQIDINIETKQKRDEIRKKYSEFIRINNNVFLSTLTEEEKELFYFFNINK